MRAEGGAAIGCYREPLSGRPLLLASLPLAAVAPTPFQRDLSPTHVKRHNLRDRSLEVIRMARELAKWDKRTREIDHADAFESPALLTLGIAFEHEPHFAGDAYHPFLRKVDRFSTRTLAVSLRERAGWVARLLAIEKSVRGIVEKLRARGFRSPYLRNLVVARINPVRFHRPKKGESKPPMEMGAALTRMTTAARKFDPASIREGELALLAAVGSEDGA